MVGTDVGGPRGGCLASAGPRCPIWDMLACGAQRGGPPGSEAEPKVSPAAASPTEPKGGRLCEGSNAPGCGTRCSSSCASSTWRDGSETTPAKGQD
ncbi:hypothetical protein HPB49_019885 [Dermacentor silvarum]|uniref:Uncharacterized protein n=1 Tax=Dermacentor silvarum TaxID=543639 RepID=A0ACB8DFN6_DERSI|nr:hypothetical protein HPB49_019885 [Dermacentor silvarum]